jgi:hypothetical protein
LVDTVYVVDAAVVVLIIVMELRPRLVMKATPATSVAWLFPGGCSLYHAAQASVAEAAGGDGGGALGSRRAYVVSKPPTRLFVSVFNASRRRVTARASARRIPAAEEAVGPRAPMAMGRAGTYAAAPTRISPTEAHGQGATLTGSPKVPGQQFPSLSLSFTLLPQRRRTRTKPRRRPEASQAQLSAARLPAATAAARDAARRDWGAVSTTEEDGPSRRSSLRGGGIAADAGGDASARCGSGPSPSRTRTGAHGPVTRMPAWRNGR